MGVVLTVRNATRERRRWPRLPLAIPIFVRTSVESGNEIDKEFLEFATAVNVSAGGMLIVVRRSVPCSAQLRLEIPSAPIAAVAALPSVTRNLRARVTRMQHGEGFNLLGLKFSKPLVSSKRTPKPRKKIAAAL